MNAHGENLLNLSFIQGDARNNVPEILSSDTKYPSGQYVVDVILNRENFGRSNLIIAGGDNDNLCLTEQWIRNVGLPIRLSSFEEYYDNKRQCYYIERFPSAKIELNQGTQELKFSIPQIALIDESSPEHWDYGIPGFRLAWAGNVSKSNSNKKQAYGNFDMNINAGRWVLSGQTSGFSDNGFSTPEATFSTVMPSLKSKLILGKSMTASTLLPDFSFYGISLRSDSAMTPWSKKGYAPQISGVAASNARISVSQAGYTIASEIVPPGPFLLTSVRPVSNGDITVTIEEEDGTKTIRTYPVTTLPTLMRTGDFEYNVVTGIRANDQGQNNDANGIFALGTLDYGFSPFTLNIASIVHDSYQSAGIGMSKDFGHFGAVSTSINTSRSVYNGNFPGRHNKQVQSGFSGLVKYAKGLTNSTNLQLLTYQYTGEKYVDFAGFNPKHLYSHDNRQDRYEAIISQSYGDSFLSATGWTQSYRNKSGSDSGVNLNISTILKKVSLSLNANYGRYVTNESDDFGISMSFSIPFQTFERPHYNSNSVSYTRTGKTSFNTGFSGSVDEKISYGLNSNIDADAKSLSAYTGIGFDKLQTGISASLSDNQMGLSLSASGSVIGTQPTGLFFSREKNSTVAVLRLNNISGIQINGSGATNDKGITALYVSPYKKNDIRINMEQLPDNIELLNSVYSVVPTERAIVYRDFAHNEIKRYILRVINSDGQLILPGSLAKTEQGINAGFVANGGILLVNVLAEPNKIIIRQQNGSVCEFKMNGIQPNVNKKNEVICE